MLTDAKAPLASKTIWLGVLTTAASVLALVAGEEWIQQWPRAVAGLGIVVGVLNVVIRQFTTKPLTTSVDGRMMLLALVAPLCFLGAPAVAQEATWEPVEVEVGADGTAELTVEAEVGELTGAEKVAKRPGLSWRQRRAMGITPRNMIRVVREMEKDGSLESVDQAELSAMVLDRLMTENPKAFADPSLDWDAILSFIEALLPVILKIIALF